MCEKCWGEAYGRTKYDPLKSQAEHYRDILREKAERYVLRQNSEGMIQDEST